MNGLIEAPKRCHISLSLFIGCVEAFDNFKIRPKIQKIAHSTEKYEEAVSLLRSRFTPKNSEHQAFFCKCMRVDLARSYRCKGNILCFFVGPRLPLIRILFSVLNAC